MLCRQVLMRSGSTWISMSCVVIVVRFADDAFRDVGQRCRRTQKILVGGQFVPD
jgi:hypothetical protein